MTIKNIIQAWTNEEYRLSLSDAERSLLPANPAAQIELAETGLQASGQNGKIRRFKPPIGPPTCCAC